MPCRAADKTRRRAHPAPAQARSWQRIDAAVKMQAYQPARRPAKVVDPGNGFLTPVAALVQVHRNAEQADLVRDSAVVGVKADPGHAGSDPTGLEGPSAGSWTRGQ